MHPIRSRLVSRYSVPCESDMPDNPELHPRWPHSASYCAKQSATATLLAVDAAARSSPLALRSRSHMPVVDGLSAGSVTVAWRSLDLEERRSCVSRVPRNGAEGSASGASASDQALTMSR